MSWEPESGLVQQSGVWKAAPVFNFAPNTFLLSDVSERIKDTPEQCPSEVEAICISAESIPFFSSFSMFFAMASKCVSNLLHHPDDEPDEGDGNADEE